MRERDDMLKTGSGTRTACTRLARPSPAAWAPARLLHARRRTNFYPGVPPMSLPSILVVDDSPSLRRMIGACLRAGGYTVTEAADGKEAHEVALEGRFGMLVTDQVMPGMDGLALIRALRALPAYAGVPILMLSTEHDDRIRDQAREAGASGFLASRSIRKS